jgi:hypothetical protein
VAVAMLEGLRPKVNEIGRIRLGEKAQSGAPRSLSTFRLTSYDKGVLDAAQAIYGGQVRPWTDAPDPGMYQLVTTVAAIDILIPRSLQNVTQSYELWTGGACQRRCDGRLCVLPEQDVVPCVCAADGLSGPDRECEVITRLSVILPRLPGLGVWRLDTGGWHAATTIPSTLELLMALDTRSMVPAVLRAVQRSSKGVEKGRTVTHRFVVPVLDAPGITIGQLVEGATHEAALLTDGQPERPRPPTAEERVAARRASLEATTSAPAAVAEADHGSAGAQAEPDPSPAPIPSGAAEAVIEGEAIEVPAAPGMNAGELRDWLRGKLIGITAARERAMKLWRVDSLDRLTDEQRGALAADLEADPPA